MSTESSPDPAMDEVLEQRRADHGVRVDLSLRNGMHEDKEFLKVYGTRTDRSASLTGDEATTNERMVKIAEMPENVGWEVLVGLAEHYGYKLEGK